MEDGLMVDALSVLLRVAGKTFALTCFAALVLDHPDNNFSDGLHVVPELFHGAHTSHVESISFARFVHCR
jgi:hypothetical protein